jgi:hypothetical protein
MPKKTLLYAALLTALLAGASCSPTTVTVATTRSTTVTQPGVTSIITAIVTQTGPAATVTAPAQTTPAGTTPTTPTATPAGTAGQLSAAGAARYEASCTQTYCHAKFGEGGEDDFSQFRLSYFTDAGDMFNFTKSFMHTPETNLFLTDQQYLEVIAFLLLQNKTVQENTPFSLSSLSAVKFGGTPGTAGTTAGSLAAGGLLRYNDSCAQTYCHEKWDERRQERFRQDAPVIFHGCSGHA